MIFSRAVLEDSGTVGSDSQAPNNPRADMMSARWFIRLIAFLIQVPPVKDSHPWAARIPGCPFGPAPFAGAVACPRLRSRARQRRTRAADPIQLGVCSLECRRVATFTKNLRNDYCQQTIVKN